MNRWEDNEKRELAKNVAAALFFFAAAYVALIALLVSHP